MTARLLMVILNVILLFNFSYGNTLEQSHDSSQESDTIIAEQLQAQKRAMQYPSQITLYRPNYILPFYYTGSPYHNLYRNETPNRQRVLNEEFKAQLSFIVPLYHGILYNNPISLSTAYTQLMYWQFYAKSQYFRETNYEPEIFLEGRINSRSAWQLGLNHESNGRGGDLERSWNRLYGEYAISSVNCLVKLRLWTLVAKESSSNIHNQDIAKFLGHDNILISYNWKSLNGTITIQNIERIRRRGFIEASLSYPVLDQILIYAQFFNGYGQSLIEYNHKTTSFGVGVALKDWIN